MQISAASAAAFVPAVRSAWKRKLWPTVLCASAAFGLKLLFASRMATLYDESTSSEASPLQDEE